MTEEERQKKIDKILIDLDYLTTRYHWGYQDDDLSEVARISEEYYKTKKRSELIDRRFVGDINRIIGRYLEKDGEIRDDISYDTSVNYMAVSNTMEAFGTYGVDRILRAEYDAPIEKFEEETMEWLRADYLRDRHLIQENRKRQIEEEEKAEKAKKAKGTL